MILDRFFRVINLLEKHSLPIIVVVISTALILLWYMPVLFGMILIITVLIFIIGTFNPTQIKNSLTKLCIFLFILGLFFSPVLISLALEKHKLNHPELLIDRNNSKILEMTQEFKKNYEYNPEDTKMVLDTVQDYVYKKIPYDYYRPPFFFPTTHEVMSKMTTDCQGIAIVGYAILKNLGYDVYIVTGFGGGTHAWLRVYDDTGSYTEGFLWAGHSRSKPWVIFNESEVRWSSPADQLHSIFLQGFYLDRIIEILITSLFFVVPIGAGAVFILLLNRNRNFMVYFLAIVIAAIVALFSGSIGIINQTLMPLPIIIVGGIYLRVLSWRFPSRGNVLNEEFI